MKNSTLSLFAFVTLILSGCGCNGPKSSAKSNEPLNADYVTSHFNITIASDLSNRLDPQLYPKAVSDYEIVNILVDNIHPRILTHRRAMNQLDQFRMDFINKKQITAYDVNTDVLTIDFAKFRSNQQQRISYLRTGFERDKEVFKKEFRKTYDRALTDHYGSDIWTYLQQGIDESVVNRHVSTGKTGNTIFRNEFRNVLILITDGYIEAGIYGQGFDLSGSKIRSIRDAFNKSGENDLYQFYKKNPQFKVKPLNNPLLRDVEMLVLELYDRTESNHGATVHPTDYEIMKMVWNDWLKSSGIKRVGLYPKFSNKAEAKNAILSFLGV